MSPTVAAALASDPLRTLEAIRATAVKQERSSSDPVPASEHIGEVIYRALVRHYGSVKAFSITAQKDPSQLRAECHSNDLRLKALQVLDVDAQRAAFRALGDVYESRDPKALLAQRLKQARAALDDALDSLNEVQL